MAKPTTTLCTIVSFLSLLAMITFNADLQASERQALIIGNSTYTAQPLLNPRNDAMDMAAQLQQMGYEIFGGGPAFDLDRISIERTLRAFAQSLPDYAQAVIYYAGHGMSSNEDNYLIPVSHQLEYAEQLPDRAVSLRSTVELFKNANPLGVNIFLLDACRDNPLSRSFRSTRSGLQKLRDIPRGSFIGYAADDDQVAADGIGRNGTYTQALLQVMKDTPDIIIEVAHKRVASLVFDMTEGKQFPVSENKVYGDWCFGRCEDDPDSRIQTQLSADPLLVNSDTTPESESDSGGFSWKVVGGVVLGLIVVGALTQDDDPETTRTDSFQLIVDPPE